MEDLNYALMLIKANKFDGAKEIVGPSDKLGDTTMITTAQLHHLAEKEGLRILSFFLK